jgi:hypothetical protein
MRTRFHEGGKPDRLPSRTATFFAAAGPPLPAEPGWHRRRRHRIAHILRHIHSAGGTAQGRWVPPAVGQPAPRAPTRDRWGPARRAGMRAFCGARWQKGPTCIKILKVIWLIFSRCRQQDRKILIKPYFSRAPGSSVPGSRKWCAAAEGDGMLSCPGRRLDRRSPRVASRTLDSRPAQ